MAHETVDVLWEGRRIAATVPPPLTRSGNLDASSAAASAHATGVLVGAAAFADPRLEVAARLLLRSEGIASSQIEAIAAPAGLVAVAERDFSVRGPAAEVASNLRALDQVLGHEGDLGAGDLLGWHRILMTGSVLAEEHVGAWRDRLGWVGGPTPMTAAHVAAPPDRIEELIDDLLAYANGTAHDPVAQAALVHAQFEVIHPFADGNGRLGRLLIAWVLRRRLQLNSPPPISVRLLRDVGGYLAGLTLYRTVGPDPWVRWFAGAVESATVDAAAALAEAEGLIEGWPRRIDELRADAAARRLLEHVPNHLVLDVPTAATLLRTSDRTAATALAALQRHGVLQEIDTAPSGRPGRPRRWWAAMELLELLVR